MWIFKEPGGGVCVVPSGGVCVVPGGGVCVVPGGGVCVVPGGGVCVGVEPSPICFLSKHKNNATFFSDIF